jgi:lipoprotein NlpI
MMPPPSALLARRHFQRGLVALVAASAAWPTPAADDARHLFEEAVSRLFAAEPKRSAELFDKLVELRPEIEPELWQRGLALYYADRFADGRRQFERHKEVNPADVENVTWHFACVAREADVATARRAMLPVGADARVPMKEVLDLYRGSGSAEAVLAAADAGPENARRNHLCYAHLYLGLLAEAEGDEPAARRHMTAAATTYRMDHFMGKIAQLHCGLRQWNAPGD